ncbi:protein BIG GRAIN 1-like C [Prunus avium]|uniref:Protein BIG GRAIN 1-like C n=1 Tax=Prunus avium TaxID=42229 RepID=A0A6P5RQX9_PRUAV|nr:protein BIG GRAIN 1-like C [Prunus avium]
MIYLHSINVSLQLLTFSKQTLQLHTLFPTLKLYLTVLCSLSVFLPINTLFLLCRFCVFCNRKRKMYMREKSLKEDTFPRRRRNPSFSSSLLDSIYRSIDESNGGDRDPGYVRESTVMKKQSSSAKGGSDRTNLRRAIMIENWVEKQTVQSSMLSTSASSSSESSSGAAFSSSETDSSYKPRTKPKPVAASAHSEKYMQFQEKPKHENGGGGGFTKTKLRALKIYGELKKVKQPISPGGRIASFINSIFNSGNVKKAKMCYVGAVEDVTTSEHVSKSVSCSSSSASTFSRSCLSKPSSRAKKLSNGTKRSVRFYPVSVILGEEDSQPSSHHKCVYEEDPSLMPKPSYQKFARASLLKEDLTTVGQNFARGFCDDGDDEESDHDAESYSSSDLFELDHPVGIGRYREELPVYETTNFRTNQAIAQGLIL